MSQTEQRYQNAQPFSLERQQIIDPVRRVLGRAGAEVDTWAIQPLTEGRGLLSGVYRITGTARDGAGTLPWSLILKIVTAPEEPTDEHDLNDWKREFHAYQSGLLASLPPGVTAPRCYGAGDQAGEAAWLWLEDLTGQRVTRWSLSHFALAADHLGQLNGAYLTGHPLPQDAWLCRQMVRRWLDVFAPDIAHLPAALSHPLVRRFCSPKDGERMLRLWAERHRLSDALEALPQTFCHLDAIRNNLVLSAPDGAEQTIALDWEWTGIACVGEELAPLVAGSLAMLNVEAPLARPLDAIAFPAYLEGLRAAGWQGPADTVRFGYTASAALRFGLVWGVWLSSLIGGPENRRADVAAFYACDLDAVLEHFATVLPFLLNFGDEALELLPSLQQKISEAH